MSNVQTIHDVKTTSIRLQSKQQQQDRGYANTNLILSSVGLDHHNNDEVYKAAMEQIDSAIHMNHLNIVENAQLYEAREMAKAFLETAKIEHVANSQLTFENELLTKEVEDFHEEYKRACKESELQQIQLKQLEHRSKQSNKQSIAQQRSSTQAAILRAKQMKSKPPKS